MSQPLLLPKSNEPIRAWKGAKVILLPEGVVRFGAAIVDQQYTSNSIAVCHRGPNQLPLKEQIRAALSRTSKDELPRNEEEMIAFIEGVKRRREEKLAERAAHRPPVDGCTCGFYALPTLKEVQRRYWSQIYLEVALSGRVIEGEKGYRAERQEVLCAWLPSRCSGTDCNQHAAGLYFEDGTTYPCCWQHAKEMWRLIEPAEIANGIGTEVRWLPLDGGR